MSSYTGQKKCRRRKRHLDKRFLFSKYTTQFTARKNFDICCELVSIISLQISFWRMSFNTSRYVSGVARRTYISARDDGDVGVDFMNSCCLNRPVRIRRKMKSLQSHSQPNIFVHKLETNGLENNFCENICCQ